MKMTKDEAKQNSGFALNPVGYTGFFCGGRNPATQDCFWRCRILEEDGDQFMVELEDGNKGWIPKKEFTPLAMRSEA
jgi:hypothetical protein